MFSQGCVKNSVHRGGGVHPPGRQTPQEDIPWADTPRADPPWADTHTHPWTDTPLGQIPPSQADGYCSGRYASYWNAF